MPTTYVVRIAHEPRNRPLLENTYKVVLAGDDDYPANAEDIARQMLREEYPDHDIRGASVDNEDS
jgi:hypothetical protein